LGRGRSDGLSRRRRDLVEGPKHRGVRRHRPEEVLLKTQVLDVGTALATAGQHERGVHEDLAPVVQRRALTGRWDRRRQTITELQAVGETAKSVQADVGHDARPTGFHSHTTRAGTVHFGSALLVGTAVDSTPTVSPTRRAYPRTRRGQLKGARE